MQHCSNPAYNSSAYTKQMLLEDWDKGYHDLRSEDAAMNEIEQSACQKLRSFPAL